MSVTKSVPKVALLYIATGSYNVFWETFYTSFEKNFMPECERHYYVFTDEPTRYLDIPRTHVTHIAHQPWPLITLLRFRTFLSREKELREGGYSYIQFVNSNLRCDMHIRSTEILPCDLLGEQLVFCRHGGFANSTPDECTYDRNEASCAFIPYGTGEVYVCGGFYGGKPEAFLEMSHTLCSAVETDLSHRIIARWDDESHVNRYIVGRKDYRLLDPSYMYDEAGTWSQFAPARITILRKDYHFNVDAFKSASRS